MPNLIERLRKRHMVDNLTLGSAAELEKGPLRLYVGIDPTAPGLHIGSLAILMLLRQFQLAGHRPCLLLGGATAMIGDPSFKAQERKLLSKEAILANQAAIQKELNKLFQSSGPEGLQLLNNQDWWEKMEVHTFLRDIGKHFSVNEMQAKTSVKSRLKSGISFTEFAYPLLQAYDFYHLYHCAYFLGRHLANHHAYQGEEPQ